MSNIPGYQPPFTGHGLITTPTLRVCYKNALPGSAALEANTKHLIQALCADTGSPLHLPPGFSCFSEVYTSLPGRKDHCDIAIKYVNASGTEVDVLLLVECKRPDSTAFAKVEDLEKQVLRYCKSHLENTQQDFIYFGAAIGVKIRIFRYVRGASTYEVGWGDLFHGDMEDYVDVGNDDGGRKLLETWEGMLRTPPTRPFGGTPQSPA